MKKQMPATLAGVPYLNRNAAAAELARLSHGTFAAARLMLYKCGDDGDAALERLRRAQVRRRHSAKVADIKIAAELADQALAGRRQTRARRRHFAEVADIARETGYSVDHLNRVACRDALTVAELAEWARAHAPLVRSGRERTAEIATIAHKTGFSAVRLRAVAKRDNMTLVELGEWAQARWRQVRAERERDAELVRIARNTGYRATHLYQVAKHDNLTVVELAEWARTHSRQIIVAGKPYPSKRAYFHFLGRRYRVSTGALVNWVKAGVSLEDVAGKALTLAKTRDPERHRSRVRGGEVAAYGWRWRSAAALNTYYFGYNGNTSARREMQQSKAPMSWGKAALVRLLQLFDDEKIGPDCRWTAEKEAELPAICLPLNARDAREEDEDSMTAWHACTMRKHAQLRAMGKAARNQALAGA
jgi:hypothetical protein